MKRVISVLLVCVMVFALVGINAGAEAVNDGMLPFEFSGCQDRDYSTKEVGLSTDESGAYAVVVEGTALLRTAGNRVIADYSTIDHQLVAVENGEGLFTAFSPMLKNPEDEFSIEAYMEAVPCGEEKISCEFRHTKMDENYNSEISIECSTLTNGILVYDIQNHDTGDTLDNCHIYMIDGKGSGSFTGLVEEETEKLEVIPRVFCEAVALTEEDYAISGETLKLNNGADGVLLYKPDTEQDAEEGALTERDLILISGGEAESERISEMTITGYIPTKTGENTVTEEQTEEPEEAEESEEYEENQEDSVSQDSIGLSFGEYRYNAGLWNVPVLNPDEPVHNCVKFTLCFCYNSVDPSSLGDQRVFVAIDEKNSAWKDCGVIYVPNTGEVFRQVIRMDKPRTIGGIAVLPKNATENSFSVTAWIEDLEYGD